MKKLIISMLLLTMLLIGPISLSAESLDVQGHLSPVYACTYKWETYGTKDYIGITYGSYTNGPTISGTGTLTLQNTFSRSKKINGTYSGTKKVSNSSFTAGLGFEIGESIAKSFSYTINGEKNKSKQIRYRPRYKTYAVKQRQYKQCSGGGTTTKSYTGNKATGYAKKPDSWQFSWRYVS